MDFYENKIFTKKLNSDDVLKLETLFQDFIRKKVVVEKEENLEYLYELVKYVPPTLEICARWWYRLVAFQCLKVWKLILNSRGFWSF